MPNPTPVYVVSFDGQQLPGYVQGYDSPLSFNNITNTPIGRDGALVKQVGANLRDVNLDFLIRSELGNNVSGLDHLADVMGQYRAALAILARANGEAQLVIHDTDRYFLATMESVSAPLVAGEHRNLRYTVSFAAQPFMVGTPAVQTTFSTTGDKTLSGFTSSRRTYPVLTLPSGVTALVATDDNGHTLDFTRGSATGTITIDCGALTIKNASGVSVPQTLNSLNFGLVHESGATFTLHVSTVTGGTVTLSMNPRYEI